MIPVIPPHLKSCIALLALRIAHGPPVVFLQQPLQNIVEILMASLRPRIVVNRSVKSLYPRGSNMDRIVGFLIPNVNSEADILSASWTNLDSSHGLPFSFPRQDR